MTTFQYHPEMLAAYPNLVGGVILGSGLHNGPSPEALSAAYQAEQQAVIARIGSTPLSEIPSLVAWRAVFRSFGVDPTQYRSAAEALLRRLTKKGNIPGINLLVDIGNMVSIRYGVPVAVIDTRAIHGVLTVHLADGSEIFTNLNGAAADHPEPGEVVFSDERKLVAARRWCWRQSDESAARDDTSSVIITTEAHHAAAHADVEAAVNDLLSLLKTYAGGEYTFALLERDMLGV